MTYHAPAGLGVSVDLGECQGDLDLNLVSPALTNPRQLRWSSVIGLKPFYDGTVGDRCSGELSAIGLLASVVGNLSVATATLVGHQLADAGWHPIQKVHDVAVSGELWVRRLLARQAVDSDGEADGTEAEQ